MLSSYCGKLNRGSSGLGDGGVTFPCSFSYTRELCREARQPSRLRLLQIDSLHFCWLLSLPYHPFACQGQLLLSVPIIASLYTLFLTLGPGKLTTLLSFSHSGSLPQEEASEVYRLPASPNLSYFQSQKKSCPPPHPLSDSSTFLFNAERLRAQGLQPDSWCLHSRSSTHSLCDFR